MSDKMIGIVGGVGNYAGIDLIRKIYDLTDATCDQDHLPVSMLSTPHRIIGRTQYLLGETDINPGIAISEIIATLTTIGAEVIGIPCNTAHAKPIFDAIKDNIPASCILLHMIEEVGTYISTNHSKIKCVGVLAVTTNIYPEILGKYNIDVIQPPEEMQNMYINPAIYSKDYGIKIFANPVQERAKNNLFTAAKYLCRRGAQAIILGCTEIPLAITEKQIENSLVIDATSILALALIRESRKGSNCMASDSHICSKEFKRG